MCFALLKNYKIPIFNAAMTFIIIKPIAKLDFRFPNLGDFTTNFTF